MMAFILRGFHGLAARQTVCRCCIRRSQSCATEERFLLADVRVGRDIRAVLWTSNATVGIWRHPERDLWHAAARYAQIEVFWTDVHLHNGYPI